jgi:NADH-quinone oxidoreductase subunit N
LEQAMTFADAYSLMPIIVTGCAAVLVLLTGPLLHLSTSYGIAVAASLVAGLWLPVCDPTAATGVPGVMLTPLAKLLIPILCLAATLTLLFSHGYNQRRDIKGEEYPATILFSLFAMCVLPCATNLLILFLALEAIAFSFYILVAIDLAREQSGEAGLKYLLMGAVAAALIAFGLALIFAGSGSLALQATLATAGNRAIVSAGWGLIVIGIAFKLSLVPAHLWTPDVYQGAPAPVVAFLSTASKFTAAAALLMLLAFSPPLPELHWPLYLMSLLSMVIGNLAALLQKNIKRMLAYSSIAHMGYLALALLTGSRDGYSAVLLYGAIYTAMNLAAFGAVAALSGSEERTLITDYAGLGYRAPLRGAVLALAMLALAGVPPTAGFIGKFFIFYSALKGGQTGLAIIGIVSAATSAYFYLKVVVQLYMHRSEDSAPAAATPVEAVALGLAALAIVVIGVFPTPLLNLVDLALR